jgi:hypothetical protein
MKRVLLIISMLVLSACGTGGSNLNLSVLYAVGDGGTQLPGGVMIYIHSIDEDRTRAVSLFGNNLEMPVPNGLYEIVALGWDGGGLSGNQPFEGNIYCEKLVMNLNGGEVFINLIMTKAKCGDPFFGPPGLFDGGAVQPYPLQIHSCLPDRFDAVTGANDTNCDEAAEQGPVNSIRFIAFEVDEFNGMPPMPGIVSACFPVTNTEAAITSLYEADIRVPGDKFPMGILAYDGTNCEADSFNNEALTMYGFFDGMAMGAGDAKSYTKTTPNNRLELYLKAPFCTPLNKTLALNATGSGTAIDPLHICTSQQMLELMADDTLWDDVIVLESDIDMAGLTVNPIGNATTQFAGTFHGRHHHIHGINMASSIDNFGLFGLASNTSLIDDLQIDFAEITSVGGENVGIVAGKSSGSIINVHVNGGAVSGARFVGGIVGYWTTGATGINLTDSSNSAQVTANNNVSGGIAGYIGGAFGVDGEFRGHFNSGNIKAINGKVGGIFGETGTYAPDTMNLLTNVGNVTTSKGEIGGIGGTSGGSIYKSSSIGNLYIDNMNAGDAVYAGGIIGKQGVFGDPSSGIYDSYSWSEIIGIIPTSCSISQIGGLVGSANGTGIDIQRSYTIASLSNITDNCGANLGIGAVAGFWNAGGIPTDSEVFYSMENTSLTAEPGGAIPNVNGASNADLKNSASYGANWDFGTVWMLDPVSGYPILQ